MTRVNHLDRSWILTWTLSLLTILGFIGLLVYSNLPTVVQAAVYPVDTETAAFKIVDVRGEKGHLVVESQHFHENGSHWFYEIHTFQGREGFKRERTTVNGKYYLNNGEIAPSATDESGNEYQYLPFNEIHYEPIAPTEEGLVPMPQWYVTSGWTPGKMLHDVQAEFGLADSEKITYIDDEPETTQAISMVQKFYIADWSYTDELTLTTEKIIENIALTHRERSITGFTGNRGRLVLPQDMRSSPEDRQGVGNLVNYFYGLKGNGIYKDDGSIYTGITETLAETLGYRERIDLRTRHTKTFMVSDDVYKTEVRDHVHYMDESGQWQETSLDFIEQEDNTWLMITNDSYHALGEAGSLTIFSKDHSVGGRWYTPAPLTFEGNKASYTHDGLTWTYILEQTGVKLAAVVNEKRGPRTYDFTFYPIGTDKLTIDSEGNAVTGHIDVYPEDLYYGFVYNDEGGLFGASESVPTLVVPRAVIMPNHEMDLLAGPWEVVDDYIIRFSFDDSDLPDTAFPYTIDPTTEIIAENSNAEDTPMICHYSYYTTNFEGSDMAVGDGSAALNCSNKFFLKFTDLSAVPAGATVTSASLSLWFESANHNYTPYGVENIQVRRVLQDWTESQLTWNQYSSGNSWSVAGAQTSGDRVNTISATTALYFGNSMSSTAHVLDRYHKFTGDLFTQDVQNFINGSVSNYGWVFESDQYGMGTAEYSYGVFTDSEGTVSQRPKLEISYTYPNIMTCTETDATFMWSAGHEDVSAGYANISNQPWPWVTATKSGYDNFGTGNSHKIFRVGFAHSYWGSQVGMVSDIWEGMASYDISSIPADATLLKARWSFVPTFGRPPETWLYDDSSGSAQQAALMITGNHYTTDGTAATGVLPNQIQLDWGNAFRDRRALIHPIPFREISAKNYSNSEDEGPGGRARFDAVFNDAGLDYIKESLQSTQYAPGTLTFRITTEQARRAQASYVSWGGNSSKNAGMSIYSYDQSYPTTDPGGYRHPKLHITYIAPCDELTGTVSQANVSVFYSDTGSGGTTFDGNVRSNSTNYTWTHYRHVITGQSTQDSNDRLSTIVATGANHRNFQDKSIGYLTFDTSSLPDYSSSCTIDQTQTFQPDTASNNPNGTDGYFTHDGSSNQPWYIHQGGDGTSGGAGSTDTSTGLPMGYISDSAAGGYDVFQRSYINLLTENLPDNAILTRGEIGVKINEVFDQHYHNVPGIQSSGGDGQPGTIIFITGQETHHSSSNNFLAPGQYEFANSQWIPMTERLPMGSYGAAYTNRAILNDGVASIGGGDPYDVWQMREEGLDWVQDFMDSGEITTIMGMEGSDFRSDMPTEIAMSGYFTRAKGISRDASSGLADAPYLKVWYDLPCEGIIDASIDFAVYSGRAMDTFNGSISLVESFASANSVATTDMDPRKWGQIKLAEDLKIRDIIADDNTRNYFGFNARGRHAINDTGVTQFAILRNWLVDDDDPLDPGSIGLECPTYSTPGECYHSDYVRTAFTNKEELVEIYSADTTKDPRLRIVHGLSTALPTVDGIDIIAGGKTVIINLQGATFVAAGADFDAQRQNIINGIDGDLVGPAYWDTTVKAVIPVGNVVRTDDHTVTVTLPATSYANASATETVTVTIPPTAVLDYSTQIPASMTFQVAMIPFSLNSATPTLASNTSSLTLTLSGAGLPVHPFSGSEDVRMLKTAESDIVCTSVSGGATSVVVSCPVTGAAVGAWDVKATEATGMNATLSANTTLFTPWTSAVRGGGFSPTGSDYAIFAHDDLPYFTVQAYDNINQSWGSASALPTTLPTAGGNDAIFTSDKTRIVVGTDASVNGLWAYEFDKATGIVGTSTNPSSPVSTTVTSVKLSPSDNVLATTVDAGDYFYVYDVDKGVSIGSFFTSLLASPATKPTATCNDIDFSPNIQYIAVACDSSPYLFVYNFDNTTPSIGAKVADPTYLPTSAATSVEFSPDGSKLAVTWDSNLTVYDFPSMTTYVNETTPATTVDVTWLNEDISGETLIAIASTSSPYVEVYPFNTSTGVIGSKLSDPTPALSSSATSVSFHPQDDAIVVGQVSSPYATAYKFTGVSDDDYKVYRGYLEFDTTAIPAGATVTGAVVKMYSASDNSDSEFEITITDGALITPPISISDFDENLYPTAVLGQLGTTLWIDGVYNSLTLTDISTINTSGVTKFLVRSDNDITDPGTTPTTKEWVEFYSFDETGTDKDPILEITYTPVAGGNETIIPITGGYHTLEIVSDGNTPLKFNVDTVEVATNENIMEITDNATDWTFLMNNVMPYNKHIKAYDGELLTTNKLWYELTSPITENMQDKSVSANHASRTSLPDVPGFINTNIGPLLPISVEIAQVKDTLNPGVVDEVGSPLNPFGTDDGTTSLPSALGEYIGMVSVMSGYPARFFTVGLALMTVLLVGVAAMKLTGGSLVSSTAAMGLGILFWINVGTGVLPFWVLIAYGFFAISIIIWGRQVPSV